MQRRRRAGTQTQAKNQLNLWFLEVDKGGKGEFPT